MLAEINISRNRGEAATNAGNKVIDRIDDISLFFISFYLHISRPHPLNSTVQGVWVALFRGSEQRYSGGLNSVIQGVWAQLFMECGRYAKTGLRLGQDYLDLSCFNCSNRLTSACYMQIQCSVRLWKMNKK
jgi:hypothetical protein